MIIKIFINRQLNDDCSKIWICDWRILNMATGHSSYSRAVPLNALPKNFNQVTLELIPIKCMQTTLCIRHLFVWMKTWWILYSILKLIYLSINKNISVKVTHRYTQKYITYFISLGNLDRGNALCTKPL